MLSASLNNPQPVSGKIGLAVITYKRIHLLEKCLQSLTDYNWGGSDERVVVVDEPYSDQYAHITSDRFHYAANGGVAAAKNRALQLLMDRGCEHIFLLEDDVALIDATCCEKYITYARQHQLEHLNFGLHGPANKGLKFYYKGVCCYPRYFGAFSYYTSNALQKVGLMDEKFFNSQEHVEHSYRIAMAGLTLPFWYCADHPKSHLLLKDLDPIQEHSVITPTSKQLKLEENAKAYWIEKYGQWMPDRPPFKFVYRRRRIKRSITKRLKKLVTLLKLS